MKNKALLYLLLAGGLYYFLIKKKKAEKKNYSIDVQPLEKVSQDEFYNPRPKLLTAAKLSMPISKEILNKKIIQIPKLVAPKLKTKKKIGYFPDTF